MNTEGLLTALCALDDGVLEDVLQQRFARQEKLRRRAALRQRLTKGWKAFTQKPLVGIAAAAVCVMLVLVLMPGNAPPGILPRETTVPPEHSATGEAFQPPGGYIPAYDTPDLETLYAAEPFSLLLPRQLPEGSELVRSYRSLYDPVTNPESRIYASVSFEMGNVVPMELSVGQTDTMGAHPQVNLEDPATYSMEWYYQQAKKPGFSEAGIPDFSLSGILPAEQLTLEYVAARAYPDPDSGICSLEITLLCGEYYISYDYYGKALPAETFYEMLTSAQYFQQQK